MIKTLTLFNEGVNNWLGPDSLNERQAVDLLDADIDSGSIKSVKDSVPVSEPLGNGVTINNPYGDRSVVKWANDFFWSDNTSSELSTTSSFFGITPPNGVPRIEGGTPGHLFEGQYQYIVTYMSGGFESAPFIKGAPEPIAVFNATRPAVILSAGPDYPEFNTKHFFPSRWYGYQAGVYVSFNNRQYLSIQRNVLTHQRPIPRDRWPGFDGGDYWEDVTIETIVATGLNFIVIDKIPLPTESAVDKIRIYRTISGGSEFYLNAELSPGINKYTDEMSDAVLLTHTKLSFTDLPLPPIYKLSDKSESWTKVGGKFLTELNEVFYLAVDDRLYFSNQSNIHGWSPNNYLQFDEEITALWSAKNTILVFTKNRRYRVNAGTTFADLQIRPMPTLQGCPNWRTLTEMRDAVVWQSNDGVAAWQLTPNINEENIQLVTENKYKFDSIARFAAAANDIYYLFYDDHAIQMDFKSGGTISRRSFNADLAVYEEELDRLLLRKGGDSYKVADTGDLIPFSYTSPRLKFADDITTMRYRRFWFDADCNLTVIVFINGTEKYRGLSTGTARRQFFLPPGMTGEDLQLTITGTGTLRSYTIEHTKLSPRR